MRAFPVSLAILMATLTGSAYADASEDVVATARTLPAATETQSPPAPEPISALDATKSQFLATLDGSAQIERTSDDPIGYRDGPVTLDENPYKRRIQTEVSVSVGTGGYRSGYIASLIPVGEHGTLGIAIGKTDYGRNSVYGYGYDPYGYGYGGYSPFGYDGYGYDPLGYGYGGFDPIGYGGYGHAGYRGGRYGHPYGYARRGGETQSLAISYSYDARKSNRSRAEDACDTGFYDGDRLMEPLWVSRVRAPRTCEVTTTTSVP
ncbi:hypothetical protein OVA03_00430 [Asticcacaulis sp. SL142]|uniref:hypothetical protein n=1 Tax=Asticcacaulis sp. SL142 TaxID=2995155 RepID=UPI00226D3AB0|nr:hypothetical protein [Asticcacaulis sp. SL142]WAC48434.1 hypothetical protein OVA03_00430 [Asticcacaulis sp. SL142]